MAVTGHIDEAFRELRWVVEHGWPTPFALHDPDLASLRSDPRFGPIAAACSTWTTVPGAESGSSSAP